MSSDKPEDTSGGSPPRHRDASGRYARYTVHQIEVLEKVYCECPKPNNNRRQQLVSEFPVLANIEPRQIKIWFQNRRCRDKQRKATSKLHSVNKRLAAMNEKLTKENDLLQKRVTALVSENGCLRKQLVTAAKKGICVDPITTPGHSLRDNDANDGNYVDAITTPSALSDTNNPAAFQNIAKDTLKIFQSKATGTAVKWVQMPGMKPGLDSVGILAISERCSGVAARASGLVNLDATTIVEILKDRASWCQDCRSLEVFATTPADNGGIIELVYTQNYAPTTLAQARDFWTLRYTTTLEDGTLVVCERSLSGSGAGPHTGMALQFVRAEMLPSGYLVRPCEGGGSIVHILDHFILQSQNVPVVLRPLYESSEVVAQRMTIAALQYVRQIAQEATGDVAHPPSRKPTILRTYIHKLSRGFNDAINGFSDDGWSQLGYDATENVVITVKSTNVGTSSSSRPLRGSILCAKSSMLLKNVSPAGLVSFLRKRRSEWADFSVDSYCAASLKARSSPHPGTSPMRFSGNQIMMPLGKTMIHEQMLELIRLKSLSVGQKDASISEDVHLLQMCSENNETSVGSYSELVFAPIDDMLPDDTTLLPSGFRIISLNVESGGTQYLSIPIAQGPSSSHTVGPFAINNDAGNASSSYTEHAILTMAFQFPIGNNLEEHVASMARQYIRHVMSTVERISVDISPLGLSPDFLPTLCPSNPEALTFAQWIWQSYCSQVGGELLRGDWSGGGSILMNMWHHRDAILCFSLEPLSQFIFANQAGLKMLETTHVALQDITVDKILSYSALKSLNSEFPNILHKGFAYLPGGICVSTTGRHSSYSQAVAWKVLAGDDANPHSLAITFVNWSFI